MIEEKLTIALRLESGGQGAALNLCRVLAEPVIVRHVHHNVPEAAPGGAELAA